MTTRIPQCVGLNLWNTTRSKILLKSKIPFVICDVHLRTGIDAPNVLRGVSNRENASNFDILSKKVAGFCRGLAVSQLFDSEAAVQCVGRQVLAKLSSAIANSTPSLEVKLLAVSHKISSRNLNTIHTDLRLHLIFRFRFLHLEMHRSVLAIFDVIEMSMSY